MQIVLVGEASDPSFSVMRATIRKTSLPKHVLQIMAPGEELPAGHPAHGKGLVEGKPAVYICEGPVCSLPIVALQQLVDALSELR